MTFKETTTDMIHWLTDSAIRGVPPLSSSENLANEYLINTDFATNDERVDSLIRWETSKNFTTGFVTGFGGILSLPISIPSALAASWILQARMVAAIATIYGHDVKDESVRTLVGLALLGNAGKEVVKQVGVAAGERITIGLAMRASSRAFQLLRSSTNQRLAGLAAAQTARNTTKLIPIIGGVISGGFDGAMCNSVGRVAKEMFRPTPDVVVDPPVQAEADVEEEMVVAVGDGSVEQKPSTD